MLAERRQAEELMDDPALPAGTYQAVLTDLARVNRVTLAYRPTIDFLRRGLGSRTRFRLLDVGFGDGDMLRTIARWARLRGLEPDLTGIDLNPRSRIVAEGHDRSGAGHAIRFLEGDYQDLAGGRFDFVISSLVAHHMNPGQLIEFVRFMEREALAGWFVNDLHRHGFAYAGWPLLAAAMRWHPIVRSDGQTSIARSFRRAEWQEILAQAGVSGARVVRRFPFRLCVERFH